MKALPCKGNVRVIRCKNQKEKEEEGKQKNKFAWEIRKINLLGRLEKYKRNMLRFLITGRKIPFMSTFMQVW
jgi:hypothetical protein